MSAPPEAAGPSVPPAPRRRGLAAAAAIAALLIGVGALWFDARLRLAATQEEVARRLRDVEAAGRDVQAAANEAAEGLRALRATVAALEARLAEMHGQQAALEALYQQLARGRDDWQLAEIEQVLALAEQQLQLAGNVRAALAALELADARLARADRPPFLALRRAIARDMERLRALPWVDVAGLSLRLEAASAAVDALPLAFDERSEEASGAQAAAPVPAGAIARLGAEIWRELRTLIVVRRLDGAEPPLVAPAQAWFLRENLKLRLLDARLALLARQEAVYREDLRVAQAWLARHFDTRARSVQALAAELRRLAAVSLALEAPSLAESLEALRAIQRRGERAVR